jgi:hypothetical protein
LNPPLDPETRTDVWLTPPFVIQALGGWESFDLDPCASVGQPWRTARHQVTEDEDGLLMEWFGRVWLNPPYSQRLLDNFMGRMALHDQGIALIFARTNTEAFFRHVWDRAAALLFIRSRLSFHLPGGPMALKQAGAPSVLIAYGQEEADILAAEPIRGKFVPLRIPSSFLIDLRKSQTWAEVLDSVFKSYEGPVSLDQVYLAVSSHPKANGRRHYREKVRQQLQRGSFVRVAPGIWAKQGVPVD